MFLILVFVEHKISFPTPQTSSNNGVFGFVLPFSSIEWPMCDYHVNNFFRLFALFTSFENWINENRLYFWSNFTTVNREKKNNPVPLFIPIHFVHLWNPMFPFFLSLSLSLPLLFVESVKIFIGFACVCSFGFLLFISDVMQWENLLPSCVNTCRSVWDVDICKLAWKMLGFRIQADSGAATATPNHHPHYYHYTTPIRKTTMSVNIQIIAPDKKDSRINCRFTACIHSLQPLLVPKSNSFCVIWHLRFDLHNCTCASHCMCAFVIVCKFIVSCWNFLAI